MNSMGAAAARIAVAELPLGLPSAGPDLDLSRAHREQAKRLGIGCGRMPTRDPQVAVIGGGVVGCAVAHALTRRGVKAVLLEAEEGLALGASGANSGILHSGFDATPGELETALILRSVALREELLDELGVLAWRCGALLAPRDEAERAAVSKLSENARVNGVEAHLADDGCLGVPGEAVTDPVAFVKALADAACAGGASLRLRARVGGLAADQRGGLTVQLHGGERLHVHAAVNCAGLFADEVAALAGDHPVSLYPRKGEFIVFAPADGEPLERILLPVPSRLGKGVLVFPTVEHLIIAGPTAREREDKRDWSVEADAEELIMPSASRMYPALARARRVGAYAGLRPAGREANYVIERSPTLPGLIHVAAIRSTGLSASLAIGEHVVGMLAGVGAVELRQARPLPAPPPRPAQGAWWERAARHHTAPSMRTPAR
jgi:glycerol-3-phosphate dehydrogenase